MVHLDRENGAILLPDGSVVPYDVLVLCTGLQVRGRACGEAAPRRGKCASGRMLPSERSGNGVGVAPFFLPYPPLYRLAS